MWQHHNFMVARALTGGGDGTYRPFAPFAPFASFTPRALIAPFGPFAPFARFARLVSVSYRPGHRRARQPVGRNCKRPETLQPTRFRRPGAPGCGDRLRHGFAEPRFGGRSTGKTR